MSLQPKTWERSNKVLIKTILAIVKTASTLSKAQWFLSPHKVHKKHNEAQFQTNKEYLPYQFHHLDSSLTMLFDITLPIEPKSIIDSFFTNN